MFAKGYICDAAMHCDVDVTNCRVAENVCVACYYATDITKISYVPDDVLSESPHCVICSAYSQFCDEQTHKFHDLFECEGSSRKCELAVYIAQGWRLIVDGVVVLVRLQSRDIIRALFI